MNTWQYFHRKIYIYSLYPSRNFRKESFISEEKLNNVPLKNEDYCILTFFKDLTCLYAGNAIRCDNNGSYNFVDYDTLLNTAKSTGKTKLIFLIGKIVKKFLKCWFFNPSEY